MYLPDLKDSEGQIKYNLSRQYLFNVINTIKPTFSPKNIRALLEAKKDLHADQTKSFINVDVNIYNLIAGSQ